MTTEEKARRYDEVLKAAVVAHKDEDKHLKATLERIFPELKESEDERIRKEIIDFLRLPHPQFVGKRDHEKWISWLEKQGEQKPVVIPKFRVGDKVKKGYLTFTVEDIGEDSYKLQAYSKDGDKGSTVFLTIGHEDGYELVEQKPQRMVSAEAKEALMEEKPTFDIEIPFGAKDSELVDETITIPDGCYAVIEDNKVVIRKGKKPVEWDSFDTGVETCAREAEDNSCPYLASRIRKLKDFDLSKKPAEWSEEDEKRIEQICEDLQCGMENRNAHKTVRALHYDEIILSNISWLKSIRPQSRWKPSEEQIISLTRASNSLVAVEDTIILRNLLSDLLKLKE